MLFCGICVGFVVLIWIMRILLVLWYFDAICTFCGGFVVFVCFVVGFVGFWWVLEVFRVLWIISVFLVVCFSLLSFSCACWFCLLPGWGDPCVGLV